MRRLGRWLLRLVSVLLGTMIVLLICGMTFYMGIIMIAPSLAMALVPPSYPGSELVEERMYSGSGETETKVELYRTPDEVEAVVAFYERHLPGFQAVPDRAHGTVYTQRIDDKGWVARQAADLACTSLVCTTSNIQSYPGVRIMIFADTPSAPGTLISVSIFWPAP